MNTPPSQTQSHAANGVAVATTTATSISTKKKKVLLPPYPISMELYNAVPNYHSIVSSTTTTSISLSDHKTRKGRSLYRPEYSSKLLSPIHLEITIAKETDDDDDDDDNEKDPYPTNGTNINNKEYHLDSTNGTSTAHPMDKSSKIILYGSSSPYNTTLQQPFSSSSSFVSTWLHINDSISDDQWKMLRTTPKLYESIQARFATTGTTHPKLHNDNALELEDETAASRTKCESKSKYHYFLEMNIHPSRLCRIPPSLLGTNHHANNNSNGTNNVTSSGAIVYDRLPINCVVVRFSDQTIRIHPSQYQLLDSYYQFYNLTNNSTAITLMNNMNNTATPTKKNADPIIIVTGNNAPLSPKNHNSNMSLSMNGSFFEDEVFHTLDEVTPYQPSTALSGLAKSIHLDDTNDDDMDTNHAVLSQHLPPDDNAYHDMIPTESDDRRQYPYGTTTNTYEYIDTAATIDKLSFMSLLDSKGNFEIAVGSTDVYEQEQLHQVPAPNQRHKGRTNVIGPDTTTSRHDADYLEILIDQETVALLEEKEQFRTDVIQAQSLMDQIRMIEQQNTHIRKELYHVQMQQYRDEFILEAQRIRLIREVAQIYPITVVRNVHYSIHGLEIPFDLYSGNVSEEVISAAFGFLCHTTFLISKYLGIHVRYRLHCQSSRSAIQDTNGSTFPLFPGRQVEREQFEYGVHLLHRNIDCICKCRGIQPRPLQLPSHQIHILAKILRIYDNVNDGY